MNDVVNYFASFLGGALVSSLVFMFAFVSRLTKVETRLANLCDTVKMMSTSREVCPLHGDIDKRLAVAESKLEQNT